jgi:osmotically-inducible protein OsmY
MQLCPDEVSRRVEIQLRETAHSALALVTCEFEEGTAILRGDVPTFYLKQLAQAVARKTPGVTGVSNHIRVCSDRS